MESNFKSVKFRLQSSDIDGLKLQLHDLKLENKKKSAMHKKIHNITVIKETLII